MLLKVQGILPVIGCHRKQEIQNDRWLKQKRNELNHIEGWIEHEVFLAMLDRMNLKTALTKAR